MGGRLLLYIVPLWWKDESVIKASCLEARGFFIVVVLPSVLLPRIGYDGLAAPYADLGTFGRARPPDCSERQAVRNRTGKPFDLI
jgi:hypothetical protein